MGKWLSRHFTEEDILKADKHIKDVHYHVTEDIKIKATVRCYYIHVEWLKLKRESWPPRKSVEKQLVRMYTGTTTFENSLAVS